MDVEYRWLVSAGLAKVLQDWSSETVIHVEMLSDLNLTEISRLLKQLTGRVEAKITKDRLHFLACQPHVKVLYAFSGLGRSTIVGATMFSVMPSHLHDEASIQDVVVNEEYRNHGIGHELMKNILRMAKRCGAGQAELTSRESRVEAHRLYQSLGFKRIDTTLFRLTFE